MQLTAEPGTANLLTVELPVVCGAVDLCDKDYDAILPSDVIKELQQIPVASVIVAEFESVDDDTGVSATVVSNQVLNENDDEVVDVYNAEYCNNNDQSDEVVSDDVHKLTDEQKSDETLLDCRNMAHQGKGNYVISRGLLYHKDKVEGQSVCQLCVPVGRRDAVLKLAHDLVYGGHFRHLQK